MNQKFQKFDSVLLDTVYRGEERDGRGSGRMMRETPLPYIYEERGERWRGDERREGDEDGRKDVEGD